MIGALILLVATVAFVWFVIWMSPSPWQSLARVTHRTARRFRKLGQATQSAARAIERFAEVAP